MPDPLALALHPLLPVRTPREGRSTVTYGFHLELPSGQAVAHDDPLLAAFGASFDAVHHTDVNSEALQSDAFDPGRRVRLAREGLDEDGDEVIGVWDADELRRAGTLPWETAARVAAALDHGLAIEAVIVSEIRDRPDDRRSGIALLVFPPELITVDTSAAARLRRPRIQRRRRLVLMADAAAGLRWWDPSGESGPLDLESIPVSPALRAQLHELATALRDSAATTDRSSEPDFFEDMEDGWRRHVLGERARSVWEQARRELGRRYAIGLMLRGMSHPAWSPEELAESEDEDDEIPF